MPDKYDLPPYVVSRVRYYDGQFLKETEFIDEQKLRLDRDYRHHRLLHAVGVAEGLSATQNTDGRSVTVAAGTAVDAQGRMILLSTATPVALLTSMTAGTVFLEISFREVETNPADPQNSAPGNTRFTQAPLLGFSATRTAGALLLAEVAIAAATQKISTISALNVAYAGARLPGPTGSQEITLRAQSDGKTALLSGSLSVAGDLTATGIGTLGTLLFPAPPGDPQPVIKARTVPAGQGASNESTELMLFHGNDPTNGSGPDYITLRAPAIRLQTYNDTSVFTPDDSKGSNTRLSIDPDGKVTISNTVTISSGGLVLAAGPLNVPSSGLAVTGGGVSIATGGLTVTSGGLSVVAGGLTVTSGGLTISAGPLSVPSSGLAVTGGGVSIATGGLTVTSGGLTISSGSLNVPSAGLTIAGGAVSIATGGLTVTSGGLTISSGSLNVPSAGLTVAGGKLTVATGGLTVTSGGLTVTAGGLTVTTGGLAVSAGNVSVGSSSVSADLSVFGTATVNTLTFPAPPGDPAPVIKARTIPAGQGATSEATELILFHGNDGNNGSGPDLITLRAPGIRLQTYNDATVGGPDDNKGSNTRLYIDPDGKITSPMWKVTQVLNQKQGGLPVSGTFSSGGGTLLIFAFGSGWSNSVNLMGMDIKLDGTTQGSAQTWENEPGSHKTFSANALVVSGIGSGSHTIQLTARANTVTDGNDFFTVTVLELPF